MLEEETKVNGVNFLSRSPSIVAPYDSQLPSRARVSAHLETTQTTRAIFISWLAKERKTPDINEFIVCPVGCLIAHNRLS
jgi:hypothetical protein